MSFDDILKIANIAMFFMNIVVLFILPGYRRQITKLEEADTENKKELQRQQSEINTLNKILPERYVSKKEYMDTIGRFTNSFDEVKRVVYRIDGKLKGRSCIDE